MAFELILGIFKGIGPAVNTAVEAVETHIAKTIEGIMFRNQWPRDVVVSISATSHCES